MLTDDQKQKTRDLPTEQTGEKQETSSKPALDASVEASAKADDLARCSAERDEYLDGWKRAKADLVNHKREEAERLERFAKFATEDLVRDLLSVVDSFDLGVQAVKDDEVVLQGMVLVRSQLESVLARRGLERLTAPPGTLFDPARHEAVGETAGAGPPGTVAEEVSVGFLFHGNVLRPARVMLVATDQRSKTENEKQ